MKPIGLTGGIATGKSTVLRMFSELGAIVVTGDEVARDVLSAKSSAVMALASEFGPQVLMADGGLNRIKMLDLLLESPENMTRQLKILSPYILPAIDRKAECIISSFPHNMVIVEAPLLFEYGKRERYGPIVAVITTREIQIQRLMIRGKMDQSRAEKIVDLQIPSTRKAEWADYIIDNGGSPEITRLNVEKLFPVLLQRYWNQ